MGTMIVLVLFMNLFDVASHVVFPSTFIVAVWTIIDLDLVMNRIHMSFKIIIGLSSTLK